MNWSRPFSIISRRWKDLWPQKYIVQAISILLCLALSFSLLIANGGKKDLVHLNSCNLPAIFNFGDSNSDTGGLSAAFHRLPYPNGYFFFNKPSGRYCDGRDIIDFVAEKLGLPYLNAYLDSIGTNFRHGANFATGGSTIQKVDSRLCNAGFSPISLDVQLWQFEQFKERTLELYNQGRGSYVMNSLPRPDDFSRALYTMDIGQNDLHAGFNSMTDEQILESIPGARTLWIHNTGPIGCLPYMVTYHSPKPENMDEIGCVKTQNDIAQEFNKQLKDRVSKLRKQLPDTALTYTDIYTAKYSLISEAKEQGFADPFGYCCGNLGDKSVQCWEKAMVNGTETFADLCSNSQLYISWDGVHYSQAANQIVANKIINGSLSDPPTPIYETCSKLVH